MLRRRVNLSSIPLCCICAAPRHRRLLAVCRRSIPLLPNQLHCAFRIPPPPPGPKTALYCQVARVDMREMLTMAAGERAASYDGLQVRVGRHSFHYLGRVATAHFFAVRIRAKGELRGAKQKLLVGRRELHSA